MRGKLDTAIDYDRYVLAEHITTPRRHWKDAGLTRKYAPAEDTDTDNPLVKPGQRSFRRTGYRGVKIVRRAEGTRYEAQVWTGSKRLYIGIYDTPEAAARAYDDYVTARGLNKPLNFPDLEQSA